MCQTNPDSVAVQSPQSQAQRAFPPAPQILGGGGAMTAARRVLSLSLARLLGLVPALLAALLFTGAFAARAADLFIEGAATQTNGGNTLNANDSLTVRKNASITISTNFSSGINVRDKGNNRITNNGAITTSGDVTDGIDASSNKNQITNNGAITTSGSRANGILANNNNQITNNHNGVITIKGQPLGAGINADRGNTIINNGVITTTGTSSDLFPALPSGIEVRGGQNHIINNRTITTTGTGISVLGDNSVTNNGTITTSGKFSEGIDVDDNNIVINNSAINTSGEVAHGIDVSEKNTVTNNGVITTSGRGSLGIDGFRDNTFINKGTITTRGNEASGFKVTIRNTVRNSGAIITQGDKAHGIEIRTSNKVFHSNAITTRGEEAYGIKAGLEVDLSIGLERKNEINTSGVITTSGLRAAGIWMSNDNTLNHSGRITTTGADAPGIQAGNDNTLTLNGAITTSNRNSHGVVTGTGTKLTIGANSRIIATGANSDGIRIGGLRAGSTALNQRGHIEANATGITAPYISRLENSGRIIGRTGDGVTLNATANPGAATVENSGVIQGQTHGLNYGIHAISNLQNSGTIMGMNVSGITFTGATTNPATITNSGKIQGGTYGLNYGNNAIASLQNNNGTIQGGARAALSASTLATLNNSGTIASTSAAAITLTGRTTNPATITNSGAIKGGTYGLNYGNNAIASLQNNNGTIQGGTRAALSASTLATLSNSGTIASTSAAAITLTGNTTQVATITNSGAIKGGTYGLNYGNNAIAGLQNNNGTIQGGTRAALSASTLATLNNSGTIASTSAAAITLTGNTTQAATITNTGTIRGGTYGLNYGNNPIASLTNTSPRTLRGGSREALSAGSLLRLENSGAILSDKASAITLTRTATQAATITNSGTIQGNIHGLDYNNNAIASLTNSGTIRATTGIGIKAAGLTRLNNTGTIEGQTGIQITRTGTGQTGATINNAGTLRSLKGASGTALDLQGPGRDTLKLQAGSTLEGQVRWDGQDDTLNLATGPARLTLIDNNAEPGQAPTPFTINTNGRPFLLNTTPSTARGQAQTTVTVLDPARIHTRTESTQSQWTGAVFQSLAQQQGTRTGPNARNSTAAVHQTLWVRPFGGLHNVKRDGLTPAARYRYGGALAGYAVASTDWQAGGFVGAAQDTLAARGPGADAEGRHVFAGAYARTRWQALNLKAGLLFGQSRTETEWQRLNNQVTGGQERVVYEGKRYVVSPELGLATRLTVRGVALEPALSLRYLGLFGAEEDERLVAGREPLRFRAEDRHVGLVRASVGMPLRFPVNAYGGQLYGQLRVGAEGRKRFGGERIEARRGDGLVRFKVADEATVRGFMGAGFEYVVPDLNLSFSADFEASYGSEAVLGVQGQLGVVWGF